MQVSRREGMMAWVWVGTVRRGEPEAREFGGGQSRGVECRQTVPGNRGLRGPRGGVDVGSGEDRV